MLKRLVYLTAVLFIDILFRCHATVTELCDINFGNGSYMFIVSH